MILHLLLDHAHLGKFAFRMRYSRLNSRASRPLAFEGGSAPTSPASLCSSYTGSVSKLVRILNFPIFDECLSTAMLCISFTGYHFGNPARLVYGTDYAGRVCGGPDKKNQPFITFPRVFQDVKLSSIDRAFGKFDFFGVCRSGCPR